MRLEDRFHGYRGRGKYRIDPYIAGAGGLEYNDIHWSGLLGIVLETMIY